jgi:carbon monoxide dehydrogenase subunit G
MALRAAGTVSYVNVGSAVSCVRCLRCAVFALAIMAVATAVSAQAVDVRAERDGSVVRLRASVWFAAPPAVVWSVLTDYEGQARFVPGISRSEVLSRDSTGSVVRQRGSVRMLFFSIPFDVEYATIEQPLTVLSARLVRGSVRRMESTYRLRPDSGGTRLEYDEEVEASGWLPPLISQAIVRRQVERELAAIRNEIERRIREGLPP